MMATLRSTILQKRRDATGMALMSETSPLMALIAKGLRPSARRANDAAPRLQPGLHRQGGKVTASR